MTRLFQAELFKLRHRPMTWILGGLVVAVIAMLYAVLALAVEASSASGNDASEFRVSLAFENTVTFGDSIVLRVVSLMAIVLAGASAGGEYRWRTVVTTAAWTGDRRRVLAARMAAYGVVAAAWVVAGYVTVVAGSFASNAARGALAGADVGARVAPDVAVAALRTLPGVLAYVVVTAWIATWSRSSVTAVGVGVVVLLLEPLGVGLLREGGGVLATAARFTLSGNIDALLAANGPIAGSKYGLPDQLPSAWEGAGTLLVFSGLSAWFAMRMAARRDVTE